MFRPFKFARRFFYAGAVAGAKKGTEAKLKLKLMIITLQKGDITKLEVDAIVNAAGYYHI